VAQALKGEQTWNTCYRILTCNPPYLSKIDIGPRRLIWTTIHSSNVTAEAVSDAAAGLLTLAGALSAATPQG